MVALSIVSMTGCGSSSESQKSGRACPDWSSSPTHNYENKDFSNFGCAYYNNVAVQLSDPADLEKGHGQNRGSADREGIIIQKYISAAPQTVTSQSTSSR